MIGKDTEEKTREIFFDILEIVRKRHGLGYNVSFINFKKNIYLLGMKDINQARDMRAVTMKLRKRYDLGNYFQRSLGSNLIIFGELIIGWAAVITRFRDFSINKVFDDKKTKKKYNIGEHEAIDEDIKFLLEINKGEEEPENSFILKGRDFYEEVLNMDYVKKNRACEEMIQSYVGWARSREENRQIAEELNNGGAAKKINKL